MILAEMSAVKNGIMLPFAACVAHAKSASTLPAITPAALADARRLNDLLACARTEGQAATLDIIQLTMFDRRYSGFL
ncbi:hypothetical protein [Noviherbaspirillum sp. UKPF54]|uniref:hypothetical protein n=1 Tax=Noviherbaspirillum sp. UKPF54 TaxID=2601898 RepID=UPI0011B1926D|nr:hypothetical protein [Noviherbaspirillum sp. UKPF54]QDZ27306.1 hypothetical protein FAY22_04665 [Noviherbaspirillum sp. UKPF54]